MIPLMKNAFVREHETRQALADFILRSPRLSMDVKCAEFEKAFATFQRRQHAVLFNSGASANLALLQALKNLGRLNAGSRVGFFRISTWSTNVMPIIQMGMIPVPIDCEPSTINSMSQNLSGRLSEGPLDAFFVTNAIGYAGDLDNLARLCESAGVLLLEDNCVSCSERNCRPAWPATLALPQAFRFLWPTTCRRSKAGCSAPMMKNWRKCSESSARTVGIETCQSAAKAPLRAAAMA